MDEQQLRKLLDALRTGEATVEDCLTRLRSLPFEDGDGVRVDVHRALRCGFGEVVFCASKTVEQVREIFARLVATGQTVLATRATSEMADAVRQDTPEAVYCPVARTITHVPTPVEPIGHVAIVAAGTSDLPVAEEARVTAEVIGARVTTHYDCGVAGLHRLLAETGQLQRARVIVAVAGMEGALPSVVAGLVAAPVIAVPTSVGYGTSFGGVSALLTMLNSCASGVSVVNIDNGFAGGYNAAMINRLGERTQDDD